MGAPNYYKDILITPHRYHKQPHFKLLMLNGGGGPGGGPGGAGGGVDVGNGGDGGDVGGEGSTKCQPFLTGGDCGHDGHRHYHQRNVLLI